MTYLGFLDKVCSDNIVFKLNFFQILVDFKEVECGLWCMHKSTTIVPSTNHYAAVNYYQILIQMNNDAHRKLLGACT